jgi:hypothetical protein
LKLKFFIVVAALALLVLVVPPVSALTLPNGALDESFRNRHVSGPSYRDLDDELANILAREDRDKCPRKCTTDSSEGGTGGGGPGGRGTGVSIAFGATLGLGQSFAGALLGAGDGGGSIGSSGGHANDGLNLGANLLPFAPGESESVSATPLPAALPLFASGLSALGLLGWWRKRKTASLGV